VNGLAPPVSPLSWRTLALAALFFGVIRAETARTLGR